MKISGDVSPAQSTQSSTTFNECGSGVALVNSCRRQPSKSSRITRATRSSKGLGSDCAYCAPSRISCGDALGMLDRVANGEHARAGERDERERGAHRLVEDGEEVPVPRGEVVPCGRPIRPSVAARVDGRHPEVAREVRDLALPHPAVGGRAGRARGRTRRGSRCRSSGSRSSHRDDRRTSRYPRAVFGSMAAVISEMRLAGKPPIDACLRISSSLGAM